MNKIIKQALFPHIYAAITERNINNNIKKFEAEDVSFNDDSDDALSSGWLKELKELHQNEKDRKRIVEEKARAGLFTVSLSIGLISGGLGFISQAKGEVNLFALENVVILFGVMYLLASSITVVRSLYLEKLYDVYLGERFKNNAGKIEAIDVNNNDKCKEFYKNIKLNQYITNKRANYAQASFVGIVNGLILMTIFFIFFSLATNRKPPESNTKKWAVSESTDSQIILNKK